MEKLLFFMMCFLSALAKEKLLLASISSQVAGGNYSYFTLYFEGRIGLYLHTKSGDADLYISQYVILPTFEPKNYCLQSSTCGLDIIHIPRDFFRPIFVGVYGHPSQDLSVYLLEVYYRIHEDILEASTISDGSDEDDIKIIFNQVTQKKKTIGFQEYEGHTGERPSSFWNIIWSLLDIMLDIIFL